MSCIHLVFNIVKLTLAPTDLIVGRHPPPQPPPILVDGEEEFEVEEILDSKMFRGKLRYKIKWEGYGPEHNTWEYAADIHSPKLVTEFHRKNPRAPHYI